MNKIKKALAITPAIILMLGLTTLPAFARNGSDDSSTNTQTTTSQSEAKETIKTPEVTSQNKTEVNKEASEVVKLGIENETENESKDIVNEFKKTDKEHSQADRKKNCDAAENGLETKLTNLSKNALAFQTKIDGVLTMSIAYQNDNNLHNTVFDALVTTAQKAQVESASSVSALSSLNTNLDCSNPSVAQNVAAFKVAAKKARADLKAYKDAVKAILKSIETSKEGN